MTNPRITRIRPDMAAPRPPWRMPEPRDVAVKGHRIRYWEKGEGRPLVLAHGFSGSAPFEWGRVIDALAQRCRVIAPQCVGFAPSEQPDIDYSTDALVGRLGGFFEALGLADIVLLGESFGGWLVGSYAVRAAALGLPPIAKLAIVGGPVGKFKTPAPETSGFYHAAVAREVEAWLATQPQFDNDGTREKIVKASGLRTGELSLEAVSAIAAPTLLIWGDKDALIPLSIGEAALGAIPDARLVVFEDIGHIPSVECPTEFVQAVSAFAGSP
ncbi:MAG: alpha/beta fold hydrolase [Caulobacterales bacterium]